jgi:hypothetical protein
MRLPSALALLFLLVGCGDDRVPPSPTSDRLQSGPLTDREINIILTDSSGVTPECIAMLRSEGFQGMAGVPLDRCFEMMPQQRWQGLWRNFFEGSRFCPSPATECSHETPGEDIWLTFPRGPTPVGPEEFGGLYAVEFIGRRTRYPDHFGHMGMSDHEMIVDRLISIRMIEPPTPPMTEVEIEAERRECEAAPNCIPAPEAEQARQ